MAKIKGIKRTLEVFIDGRRIDLKKSLKVICISPSGFNWSYAGAGPGQLALAILLEFTSEDKALRYFEDFKWEIIANLPEADFEIDFDVEQWIDKKDKEFKKGF